MSNDYNPAEDDENADPRHRARKAADAGYAHFAQQRFHEAWLSFEEALRHAPADSDLRYNLACAAWAAGNSTVAQTEFLRLVEAFPDHSRGHDALARLLHQTNHFGEAYAHSSIATELKPLDPEFSLTHAAILDSLERPEEAWEVARAALKSDLTRDRAMQLILRIAPKLGRDTEAINDVGLMLAHPPADAQLRRRLHFAAAGFLEKLKRYDEAFDQARQAHRFKPRPYDSAARAAEFERRITYWTPERMSALPRASHGSTRPVFIVGMPRSGTSLVEQILGCHPDIFAAGELGAMNQTAKSLDSLGLPYPQSLSSLTVDRANDVSAVYLNLIGALNNSVRYVTDKMPLNFMYLDLIQALLPESRIIHCTRDPLDTCISLYMTEFEIAYDFAEDLKHLGTFYALYKKLMDHWLVVSPLEILEVRYEDVVADVETQTRRMLEFLKLPFDERCLRFHESARSVKTASRDQVRRPIYQSSVGRWKHYSRHLAPLREGLGEARV